MRSLFKTLIVVLRVMTLCGLQCSDGGNTVVITYKATQRRIPEKTQSKSSCRENTKSF